MDSNVDLKNETLSGNYCFQYRDNKMLFLDIEKNEVGDPTFKFRLQDMSTGAVLDTLDVYATPGDHEYLKVVK